MSLDNLSISNIEDAHKATWIKYEGEMSKERIRLDDFTSNIKRLLNDNNIPCPEIRILRDQVRELCEKNGVSVTLWKGVPVITKLPLNYNTQRGIDYERIEKEIEVFDPKALPDPDVTFLETDEEGSLKVESFETLSRLIAIHRHVYETYHYVPPRLAYRSKNLIVRVDRQLKDVYRHSSKIHECIMLHAYGASPSDDRGQICAVLKERYEYANANHIRLSKMAFAFKSKDVYVFTTVEKAMKILKYKPEALTAASFIPKYVDAKVAWVFDRERLDEMAKRTETPKERVETSAEAELMVLEVLKLYFPDMERCAGRSHCMDLYSYTYRFRVEVKFLTGGMRKLDNKFCNDMRAHPERFYLLINMARATTCKVRCSHIWLTNGYDMTYEELMELVEAVKSYTDSKGIIHRQMHDLENEVFFDNSKTSSRDVIDEIHETVKRIERRLTSSNENGECDQSKGDITLDIDLSEPDDSVDTAKSSEVSSSDSRQGIVSTSSNEDPLATPESERRSTVNDVTSSSNVDSPVNVRDEHSPVDDVIATVWERNRDLINRYMLCVDFTKAVKEESQKRSIKIGRNELSERIREHVSKQKAFIKKWNIPDSEGKKHGLWVISTQSSYTKAIGKARNGNNGGSVRILQELNELDIVGIKPAKITFFEHSALPQDETARIKNGSNLIKNLKDGAYLVSVHKAYFEYRHDIPIAGKSSYMVSEDEFVDLGEQICFFRCKGRCPAIVDYLLINIYRQNPHPSVEEEFECFLESIQRAIDIKKPFCEYYFNSFSGERVTRASLYTILYAITYLRTDRDSTKLVIYGKSNEQRIVDIVKRQDNYSVIVGMNLHINAQSDGRRDTHNAACLKI